MTENEYEQLSFDLDESDIEVIVDKLFTEKE